MNVTVIGCGRWGSFLAWYLSGSNRVTIYGRSGSKTYEELKNTRKNEYVSLSEKIVFTDDLREALTGCDAVFISVGAQGFPELASQIKNTLGGNGGKEYILCMKGITADSGRRLSEVLLSELGQKTKYAVWLGPGHPEDFVRMIPNCMLFASEDGDFAKELCERYSSPLIRFYYSTDVIGCELGAATKNVIGIAAGILDAMNRSSLKGALMARAPREIARLAEAMNGKAQSIYGLCHIGDYEATLFSEHSHNRKFGEAFILGVPYGKLAEGVGTVRSVMLLKERYGVDMPICTAVYDIIHGGKDPGKVMAELFLRERKSEF